mgnify:CR=1 FL=1
MNDVPEQKAIGYLSRAQQRAIVTISGIVLMCLAALIQLPNLKWTFTHGLSHGFDSGKSAHQICWTIVLLTMDLATLSIWLYARPANPGWVIVPPVIVFLGTFVAFPLASFLWLFIQVVFL